MDWARENGILSVRGFSRPPMGGDWRYGFRGRRDFDENQFGFNFYLYSPYDQPTYLSPWYYYPGLPPYVDASEVDVVPGVSFSWNSGPAYPYRYGYSYNSYGSASLNRSVDDIQAAFSNQDEGAIDSILPPSGQVAIFVDGRYQYSVSSDEFAQMMRDNIANTDTSSFRIDSVRGGGGRATVTATQTFTDADGYTHSVQQQYGLTMENGAYVVTDFMTNA